MRPAKCRARFSPGKSSRAEDPETRFSCKRSALNPSGAVVLVRLLLFLALAAIAAAAALYLVKRDRRYLRFIGLVVRYTLFLLLGTLAFYAVERLLLV
jgi:hypothetical protein